MIETTHKLKKETRQNLAKKSFKIQKNTTIIDTETAENTLKDNKNKQFIGSNLASLPLLDPSITETQVTTEKQTQINIVQKEQMATNNTKSYSNNFIRIIDNIPKMILPKNSEDIKNRIKAISTKHIKKDILYTLYTTIVIKNVNPKISTEAITNYVSRSANNIKVRRFFLSVNLHPLPIICITCDKQLAIKYIHSRRNKPFCKNASVKHTKNR